MDPYHFGFLYPDPRSKPAENELLLSKHQFPLSTNELMLKIL